MSRLQWVGLAIAVVGALAAIGVLLGVAFGEADVRVTAVEVTGESRTGPADCPDEIVRTVDVSVTVRRGELDARNPQWWAVGVTVRASALGATRSRAVKVAPGTGETVTIPFSRVEEGPRASIDRPQVVVQVLRGNRELVRTTRTATLPPVAPEATC